MTLNFRTNIETCKLNVLQDIQILFNCNISPQIISENLLNSDSSLGEITCPYKQNKTPGGRAAEKFLCTQHFLSEETPSQLIGGRGADA